ncbi:MAG: D-tyrosyl-tRNA(Tyr) deacylase [Clostridiales bacterium]|nr:D-tyrosyl-tRNA(Tyr) deacylase [Clostridiales bacterium]
MRAVVQRVREASVTVGEEQVSAIGHGLMVLIGVEAGDTEKDAQYMADKIRKLRIFEDAQGKMNLALADVGGHALLVSQFTLLGDARGQNRPGFTQAEEPERANTLYELCCDHLAGGGIPVARGRFRAHMHVALVNDGPVTLLLDSRKQF